ncbi:MAG TPA: excisionase family DNA-binding protein [Chloroflexota bacterium]|nr:excisionase family DNA-binding protein [Chloroflexota bacterium]
MAVIEREPVRPQAEEAAALKELDELLAEQRFAEAAIVSDGKPPRRLPPSVAQVLAQVVHELARGNAVTIVPVEADLTTQQAADLLNVSRPFLVKLLDNGAIPCHRAGSHRRVRAADVLAYRDRRRAARRQALAEMAREAQEMGLYE